MKGGARARPSYAALRISDIGLLVVGRHEEVLGKGATGPGLHCTPRAQGVRCADDAGGKEVGSGAGGRGEGGLPGQ